MSAHAHADDIRKHIKTYMMVFGSLLVLTVVTVGVSYLHLTVAAAVAVALAVALVKGSLVALFFMHLSNEVATIYRVLLLTVAFFIVLMMLPTTWWSTDMGSATRSIWDESMPASRMVAATGHGEHGEKAEHAEDAEHGGH